MSLLNAPLLFIRALLSNRARIAAENMALRQQLAVLRLKGKRPSLKKSDRVFWVLLSRVWNGWRSPLVIVQPQTVIRWHRKGFQLYWHRKSYRNRTGRPKVDPEIRGLIRRVSRENPIWGSPRIQAESRLLGYEVSESIVAKYRVRRPKPPSQSWRAFLRNHSKNTAAVDFFTVPTATFRILYCFVVLLHHRWRIVHFNVTEHPTTYWTAQQIVEAFPYEEAPKYLIRDRDSTHGEHFRQRVQNMGVKEVIIAARSPWQNPFVERMIGSIRRDCRDHLIILNDRHLKNILASYLEYYHYSRTHQSLERNSPFPREVEERNRGRVVAIPMVGGLYHRYTRAA